jgi:hypothetical protein
LEVVVLEDVVTDDDVSEEHFLYLYSYLR